MARLFDDASSHFLEADSAPITALPFTMAFWGRSDDAASWQTGMWLGDKDSSNDFWQLVFAGSIGGDPLYATSKAAGTSRHAITTSGFTANTWHHACGVFASTTSRSVYIDGGSKNTNTQSSSPSGVNRISICRRGISTPDLYFSGDAAEAAIWNIALSDAEVALLATGVSPLMVRPDALVNYWPIIGRNSPETDLVGGRDLTVTGATVSNHPRIFYIPQKIASFAAAAAAGAVSQSIEATATGAATMSRFFSAFRSFSATVTGVATLAALALTATFVTLSSTVTAAATMLRLASLARAIEATVVGAATMQRFASLARILGAAVTGSATLSRIAGLQQIAIEAVVTGVASMNILRLAVFNAVVTGVATLASTLVKFVPPFLGHGGLGIAAGRGRWSRRPRPGTAPRRR